MNNIKGYKELIVWQKSILLTDKIYSITRAFPKEELFGLVNQMRRASVSVPSNIAEGASRLGTNEFIHFLSIAKGSLAEINTQIIIAQNQSYITKDTAVEIDGLLNEIDAMLHSLILSLKRKKA